jgi:hypothetical protein
MQTVTLSFMISNFICIVVIAILWRQYHRQYAGFGFWLADYSCSSLHWRCLPWEALPPIFFR